METRYSISKWKADILFRDGWRERNFGRFFVQVPITKSDWQKKESQKQSNLLEFIFFLLWMEVVILLVIDWKDKTIIEMLQ